MLPMIFQKNIYFKFKFIASLEEEIRCLFDDN